MFLGFTQNRKILIPIDQYHLDKQMDVLKFFSSKIEKTRKLILVFEKRDAYYITKNENAYVVSSSQRITCEIKMTCAAYLLALDQGYQDT